MKKLIKKLNNNDGMTLLEVIIAFFLVSIASLMLLTGFTTAAALVRNANDIKNGSSDVATVLELDKVAGDTATVNMGTNMGVDGYYVSYKDDQDANDTNKTNTNVKYKVFIPTGSDSGTD